jgi:hypothetical protein
LQAQSLEHLHARRSKVNQNIILQETAKQQQQPLEDDEAQYLLLNPGFVTPSLSAEFLQQYTSNHERRYAVNHCC